MECNFARRADGSWLIGLGSLALAIGVQLLISASAFCQDEPEANSVKTLELEFKDGEETESTLGEVIVEYKDGSLLFLSSDGQLRILDNTKILNREESEEAMQALNQDEVFEALSKKLPPGFAVKQTTHYVIVYNTSSAYANWVGELFERLYRNFFNYWKRHHDVELEEPRFPLVAVVFDSKESYFRFAKNEVGEDAAKTMIGYYSMLSNRMVSYDLTGVNRVARNAPPQMSNTRIINNILKRPEAERTVATIVHEAVHQIAYNSGLQVRLADNPRWLSEGLAMYFESPDFKSSTGWSMGKVNKYNLIKFSSFFNRRRKPDSLTTLISDDARLLNSKLANDAYPESWALTYFLMKARKKQFKGYLQELATLPPAGPSDAKARVEMFKKHFGELDDLDRAFVIYMRNVRPR